MKIDWKRGTSGVTALDGRGKRQVLGADSAGPVELAMEWKSDAGGLRLEGRLRARESVEIWQWMVLRVEVPGQPGRLRFFQNGFQSWTPTRSISADRAPEFPRLKSFERMNHFVDSPNWRRKNGLLSSLFTVLQAEAGGACLAGFVRQEAGLGEAFLVNRGGVALELSLDYGGKRLEAGETLEAEPLLILEGEALDILDRYATRAALEMKARVSGGPSLVGWCSWYEFYTRVREADMNANLEALGRKPPPGLRVVQLDDGYQTHVGDWLSPNAKFPEGLEPLAQKIRAHGWSPGLWLAPFFVSPRSELARKHPDWLLKKHQGVQGPQAPGGVKGRSPFLGGLRPHPPKGRWPSGSHGAAKLHPFFEFSGAPVDCGFNPMWMCRTWALDLTHPGVLGWLRDTFEALRGQGFDYFKIDFLFAGLRHGLRHDARLSPVEAYRGGLRAIREAIGEQGFLLGCGAPLGASVGFVDGMRVSADVKEEWRSRVLGWLGRGCAVPSARDSLLNNLTRAFLHRRWWLNDPDCFLVRDRRSRLTPDEVRLLITVFGMTGGLAFLSDDLSRLAPDRFGWLMRVLPPSALAPRTPDLLTQEQPTRFVLDSGSRTLTAYLNWDSAPRMQPLAPAEPGRLRFDFWNARPIGEDAVPLPAHGVAAILETRTAGLPTLIGADLHLLALLDGRIQCAFEEGRLRVHAEGFEADGGRLWLWLPPGWRMSDAAPPDGVAELQTWTHGLVLRLAKAPPWSLSLALERQDPA